MEKFTAFCDCEGVEILAVLSKREFKCMPVIETKQPF